MTDREPSGKLKCMRRLIFGAGLQLAATCPLQPQQVPGRDLLQFPVGTIAEAPALASLTGDGVWNPAATALPDSARYRVGAAALQTGSDQSLSAQILSAAVALPTQTTVGLSFLRVAVSDILQTSTDPQSIGGEVPYATTIVSATVARRQERLVAGLAARYRTGTIDREQRSALGIDAGLLAERLPVADARVGLSTFLWRPANRSDEQTTFNAAADLRVFGTRPARETRAGYSLSLTEGLAAEHYVFTSARSGVWEGRAGLSRTDVYERTSWRLRLGVGVHYAGYIVGVAREENGSGLAPYYQFCLTALIH